MDVKYFLTFKFGITFQIKDLGVISIAKIQFLLLYGTIVFVNSTKIIL